MFTRRKAGTLKHGRYSHGVVFDGEKFLVIGGFYRDPMMDGKHPTKNEVCTLEGTRMTCVEQPTYMDEYNNYPELFLVGKDFGKDVDKC